jgi:hypothetical protein
MAYLSATTIVKFCKPSESDDAPTLASELGFLSETSLETFVTDNIIPGVEARVQEIIGVAYTSLSATAQADVKLAATQAAVNVLLYIRMNKMGPVITNPQGFNLQVPIIQAFTPEIMAALERYVTHTECIESSEYKTDGIKETGEESW